ncbi:MAG: DNA-processing protein DprA [Spirochaetaceae bacterium]|jgi:DNA processing protein|nr:DNA-processing protein DprA [Spirochaetaceae bacterium]
MNTLRGLLDLAIAHLPLKTPQKVKLAQALQCEADLRGLTASVFAAIVEEGGSTAGGALNIGELFLDVEAPDIAPRLRAALKEVDGAFKQAEKDALLLERRGMDFVSIADGCYPPALKTIYDPPAVLFYKGNITGLYAPSAPLIAVVGTRKPSGDAMAWTYKTARELAAAGVCIVSGLALGIDAQAHRGAVDAHGITYAVLGSALDMVHPRTNRSLAGRIIDGGGAIISEYPPGTPPSKWRFPERNRIISGLCAATLVACAPKKSGALITADFALEQGREVWVGALPNNEPFGEGCRRLAFDGAKVITTATDALTEFNIETAEEPEIPPSVNKSAPAHILAGSLARELGLR